MFSWTGTWRPEPPQRLALEVGIDRHEQPAIIDGLGVWVARAYRRQGVLRARWAGLRERFGDFHVEEPVSDAMQAFVRAAGDGHLLTIYEPAVEA